MSPDVSLSTTQLLFICARSAFLLPIVDLWRSGMCHLITALNLIFSCNNLFIYLGGIYVHYLYVHYIFTAYCTVFRLCLKCNYIIWRKVRRVSGEMCVFLFVSFKKHVEICSTRAGDSKPKKYSVKASWNGQGEFVLVFFLGIVARMTRCHFLLWNCDTSWNKINWNLLYTFVCALKAILAVPGNPGYLGVAWEPWLCWRCQNHHILPISIVLPPQVSSSPSQCSAILYNAMTVRKYHTKKYVNCMPDFTWLLLIHYKNVIKMQPSPARRNHWSGPLNLPSMLLRDFVYKFTGAARQTYGIGRPCCLVLSIIYNLHQFCIFILAILFVRCMDCNLVVVTFQSTSLI